MSDEYPEKYRPLGQPADAALVDLFDFDSKPAIMLRWGSADAPQYRTAFELTIGALQALEQSCHEALRRLRNGDGYRAECDAKAEK